MSNIYCFDVYLNYMRAYIRFLFEAAAGQILSNIIILDHIKGLLWIFVVVKNIDIL